MATYTRDPLPSATAAAPIAAGDAQRFVQGADIPAQWWRQFRCEPLNALVEQALRANPTIPAAQAALRQALENVAAQRGAYWPTVQASASPGRQKNAVGTLAPTLTSGDPQFSLFTGQLSVAYVADVFGGNRRQVESLEAQAEVQRYQLVATRLTLVANLLTAAMQEAQLRAQIEATAQLVAIQEEQLGIMRKQQSLGAIAMGDVVAQQAALEQARATLPPLRRQLAVQRDAIALLAGRFPSDEPSQTFELATLTLPQDLPLSLPSKLVEQRPDVRAAEAQLHAASAQIGVAAANLLPQVAIDATYGGAATAIGRMLQSQNVFWTLGASLSQTLFDGGTLRARKRAAVAAFDQAGAQYRLAVLTAFQNVADTLYALRFDADTLAAALAAERATQDSLEIAKRAYALGAVAYVTVLTAEQGYRQALVARVQAQGARLTDTVALFQALGGGWWNDRSAAVDYIPR